MVLDSLRVVVDVFEVVVEIFEVVVGGCWNFWGGCRWLWVVLGGFRSSHVLVLTMCRTPMWVVFFAMVFVGDWLVFEFLFSFIWYDELCVGLSCFSSQIEVWCFFIHRPFEWHWIFVCESKTVETSFFVGCSDRFHFVYIFSHPVHGTNVATTVTT